MQDEQTPAEHYEQPIGHLWQGSTEEDVTENPTLHCVQFVNVLADCPTFFVN